MRPKSSAVVDIVTQILGGAGDPEDQVQATRLLSRLAELTGGPARASADTGLVSSVAVQRAVVQDDAILDVMSTWNDLTLEMGIASLEPSSLLRRSGNAIAMAEQGELCDLGALGGVVPALLRQRGAPHSRPRLTTASSASPQNSFSA
jgi:DNA-binding transcriptional regulator LsrR (DeoR family)